MRTLTVPATSANLGPGFDCLGLALSCYNTITFEFIESGLHIELEPCDLSHIPADSRNLIYRVFCRVLKTYGITPPGVHFAQVNEIPSMRGLGSSAASVVGGVVMADTYMGFKMTKQEMLDICASQEGHPDNILPALLGGLTVGCMDNGHVRYLRMDAPKSLRLAVFIPPFSLSTRKARSVLPKTVPLISLIGIFSIQCLHYGRQSPRSSTLPSLPSYWQPYWEHSPNHTPHRELYS